MTLLEAIHTVRVLSIVNRGDQLYEAALVLAQHIETVDNKRKQYKIERDFYKKKLKELEKT